MRARDEPGAGALWREGLWDANPGLVTLLGLCPLLALGNTTVNALGLGLATLATLLVTSVAVSLSRRVVPDPIRLPVHVLLIASTVTVIELTMQAWMPALHATLGIFLPLIVTNCLILGRAQAFASRHPPALAAIDALASGCGFLLVLVTLGTLRELIGQGTVLADAPLLFGERATSWTWQVFEAERGVLLALLPPGAFIALGLLLAARNVIESGLVRRKGRGSAGDGDRDDTRGGPDDEPDRGRGRQTARRSGRGRGERPHTPTAHTARRQES